MSGPLRNGLRRRDKCGSHGRGRLLRPAICIAVMADVLGHTSEALLDDPEVIEIATAVAAYMQALNRLRRLRRALIVGARSRYRKSVPGRRPPCSEGRFFAYLPRCED